MTGQIAFWLGIIWSKIVWEQKSQASYLARRKMITVLTQFVAPECRAKTANLLTSKRYCLNYIFVSIRLYCLGFLDFVFFIKAISKSERGETIMEQCVHMLALHFVFMGFISIKGV